jgi:DUF4097 and DUF4098 domain-containing protein YvlB
MLVSVAAMAQSTGEIPVPLTDPSKKARMKVHINYGSITVKGAARKDILVKYVAGDDDDDRHSGRKSEKDGLRRVGGGTIDLEVAENNNFVKVSSSSWSNKINLEIEVPSNIDLQVHTYNDGDLEISNIVGEVELDNYNGPITAENISGSVVATSYNGEIKVTFDKVTDGAPMSFTTYNGDIDLMFPSTLKSSLKMRTNQGEILTGFDVNLMRSGPVQKSDSKSGTFKVIIDEWVKGDVNGGGPEFVMKTYNGDILIRKK